MENNSSPEAGSDNAIPVTLEARPERRLIRPGGSRRHVDFVVRVGPAPLAARSSRTPVRLALVLDRSGSMAGVKIATAKEAALAVVARLDARDQVAVVVFDDRVDVVQPLSPAGEHLTATLRARLATIDARASTALHEGWLTGAQEVTGDDVDANMSLARVFLLTDGLANVGLQDPERIASEAAGIREKAGVGTSTFGIGSDYNESLLGPMAVAGGGQFHHLRGTADLAATFVGELGDMFAIAARQVRLEIRCDRGVEPGVISAYHAAPQPNAGGHRLQVEIGDLLPSDERHVVVRFAFPAFAGAMHQAVAARLTWRVGDAWHATDWQTISLAYADDPACTAEPRDPATMRWVGLHHAERARREAAARNGRGDIVGAQELLQAVARRVAEYAGDDPELRRTLDELGQLGQELNEAPLAPARVKELTFQSYRLSRNQKDYRRP